MNKSEIIHEALRRLEDLGQIRYADDDVQESFDDGLEIVAVVTGAVETATNIILPADVVYNDMEVLVPGILSPFAIWNNATNLWLEAQPYAVLAQDPKFEIRQGSIREWAWIGDRTLVVCPTPTVDTTLTMYYSSIPSPLAMDDIPPFDSAFHDMLVTYVTADMCLGDLKLNQATRLWKDFEKRLTDLQAKLAKRTTPERIMTIQCLSSPHISNL